MSENPEEVMVMVNHCRKSLKEKMIETGICYLRVGDSKGSLCHHAWFRASVVCLTPYQWRRLSTFQVEVERSFQYLDEGDLGEIWLLRPTHAPYYIVLHFDNSKPIPVEETSEFERGKNTFIAKLMPLSDFIGIK